ncbi:phage tail sheath C-terminal domain-containing protein [Lactococcus garvieae]|uniref:phage tail sheath C-terminal domain-containing protein n=1 Tax=Lactococcus garvieae TaxID=1363 RepID=UPI001F60BC7F|nr:phage tail sheath C-terminal domain-containing protein [Lactococcus garvieae]MCI3860139.1 phage tail sheath family protein [Lactococcus garvieae]
MAGGVWKKQNKVLPGAYINVVSKGQPIVNETEKGVVFTIMQNLKWGKNGVIEVDARSNFISLFGLPIDSPELTALRNILIKAKKVYVFNFNGGNKAQAQSDVLPWTFEASCSGSRGNDLKVSAMPDPSNVGKYIVQTFFGTVQVDKQVVTSASELLANDYFVPTIIDSAKDDDGFEMLSALTTPVLISFENGTDVSAGSQVDALIEAIETYEFNVLTAAGQDASAGIHQLLAQTVIRLRDEHGRKIQAVVPESTAANSFTVGQSEVGGQDAIGTSGDAGAVEYDHEGVIVVANGVRLKDGTVLSATMAAAFVAGATSAAEANQSLTYMEFPNAIDAVPRYNEEVQVAKVKSGVMCFISSRDSVKILSDINSLVTFTEEKNQEFSKNRVLRVLDDIANNTRETWEDNFIGKITNNATGRDLFKANRADYLSRLQAIEAITNFDPSADIVVEEGATKDSVVATIVVQPTDAMEKLYMTVIMN